MSSDELLRDLRDIDWLIGALSTHGQVDEEDLEDLGWLRARRRFLSRLHEVRSAQKGKKVIDLEAWRCGRTDRRPL
jgi:hypothetical protein